LFLDATRIAEGLFANHMAVNIFLLGAAYQGGLIPISAGAIEEAIRLNKVDAERNIQAFLWGRKYYDDAGAVEALLAPPAPDYDGQGVAARRGAELERYQNRAYAARYLALVREVQARQPALADAVARNLYKLMAYKDEYEVARLLTKPEIEAHIRGMWEEVESIGYNLHPPVLRALGLKKKMKLGGWFRVPLRALARLQWLRGTPFDPFGYAGVRREERALIAWYEQIVRDCLDRATPETIGLVQQIVALPDQIRGYERIKLESARKTRALAVAKLAELSAASIQSTSHGR
jgi:indolepyruvate ferredoxin oxidoreductase